MHKTKVSFDTIGDNFINRLAANEALYLNSIDKNRNS